MASPAANGKRAGKGRLRGADGGGAERGARVRPEGPEMWGVGCPVRGGGLWGYRVSGAVQCEGLWGVQAWGVRDCGAMG